MSRVILHLDMDAFFASVEEVANPHLRGKPLVICGDPSGRSVVSTASYPARVFGIRSGMPVTEARRLCPHAIFWTGSAEKYVHISLQVLDLLKTFTPQVEPLSIDEAFLELTGKAKSLEEAEPIAARIKDEIRGGFGLACTIGIAHNKLLAKLASGRGKPDGLRILREEEFAPEFGPLPVDVLWGIGEKTRQKLEELGIETVNDLAAYPPLKLKRVFGVVGEVMTRMAQGVDASPLTPYYDGPDEKSVGHEHTLGRDLKLGPELRQTLLRLTDQVARRLRRGGRLGRTITVKIRSSNMKTITRRRTLDFHTDDEEVIYHTARELLDANAGAGAIRLVGVSVSSLVRVPANLQEPIFEEETRRRHTITMVDSIRDRFGESAITRAAILGRRRRSLTHVRPSFHPPQG